MGTARKTTAPAARCIERDLDRCPGTRGHACLRVSCVLSSPREKTTAFNAPPPPLMQGPGYSRLQMAGKARSLPHSGTASKTASCHISWSCWINSSEKAVWRYLRKNSLLCPSYSVVMRRAQERAVMADGWPWGHTEARATAGRPMQALARALRPLLGSCPVSPNCWRNKGVETAANLPVSSA